MRGFNRKSTPKVKNGKVQRKNRSALTPNYLDSPMLGHHHDRITTRNQGAAARGEPYAEQYAQKYEDLILQRYCNEFDL